MLLSLTLLIASTCIITLSYEHSPVYVRPIQSSIVLFLIPGICIFLLRKAIPEFFSTPSDVHDATLPLQTRYSPPTSRDALPKVSIPIKTLVVGVKRSFFVSLVVAICLRVEVFRLVLDQQQCKIPGLEGFVPLIVAFYDYRYVQRDKKLDESLLGSSVRRSWRHRALNGPARYIFPATLLGCGNFLAASVIADPRSTYICQFAWYARSIVPVMQFVKVGLDCYILISIATLLKSRRSAATPKPSMVPVAVALLLVVSAIVLFVGGFIAFIFHPGYWDWTFAMNRKYFTSLAFHTSITTVMGVCGFQLLREYDILHLAMIVEFVCVYSSSLVSAVANKDPFPHPASASNIISLVLLFFGAILFVHVASISEISPLFRPTRRLPPRIPISITVFLVVLFTIHTYLLFPRSIMINSHPIDFLIRGANEESEAWATQASASATLEEAVMEYRRRYRRIPPPNFDLWYKFAVDRSSVVIDDYDSMDEDLLPFWDLEPKEIRLRTRQILSDPWNEVAEVTIRDGGASLGENLVPTHRWMEDGILAMLKEFVYLLPDMDLAFNIHDEPRVAIPYEYMQRLRSSGVNSGMPKGNVSKSFSKDGELSWRNANATVAGRHRKPTLRFEDHSFQGGTNSFYRYGSIACSLTSPAHQTYIWDPHTHCTTCASPHSQGLFLSNWTLSASPCHQPDLANLHGFYLSPSSLKNTHDLLPVFSQSKPYGYADILYPSPWNYIDKILYNATPAQDPSFAEKENTLFWRGATSEGVSRYGNWKGMARQRLVHLANNHTFPTTMLLPHPSTLGKYSYQTIPASDFPDLGLSHDVAFVDNITRCWDFDCDVQAAEFGIASKTDFQQHWRYRYLLDMDGAGFSGRFLPFLQSKSLPFKSALFREWYDSRITAWTHFVPLDLRWQGLWSTLAYFSGTGEASEASETGDGNRKAKASKYPPLKPHTEAGEKIAEEGRRWAGKVLRKEDMEVYMFRLLLEWARLTDDAREEIGFVV